MSQSKPRVLLDANVLYGQTPRDTFMHLAANGVIEARWTNLIHEEWISALLERRDDLTREKLERARDLMNAHAANSLIEGFEPLIETLSLPDQNDRHVLAAAIHAGASVIVSFNIKVFPTEALEAHGIQSQTPDDFLVAFLASQS